MSEKIFADGAMFRDPRGGAPEFVIGGISIKVDEFKNFLDEHVSNSGWVNLDVLRGKSGKPYIALNTYKPEKPAVVEQPQDEDDSPIPF